MDLPSPPVVSPPERPTGPLALGFLSVLQEAGGFVGGYLLTNTWGRPLEFRISSAVQPNKVQQILYGGTLLPYLCADLIGKALLDKASIPAGMIVTDREAALDLRLRVEVPVVWLAAPDDPRALALAGGPAALARTGATRGPLLCHARHAAVDVPAARRLLGQLDSAFDLAEPFGRIREAIAEARKLGIASRAA